MKTFISSNKQGGLTNCSLCQNYHKGTYIGSGLWTNSYCTIHGLIRNDIDSVDHAICPDYECRDILWMKNHISEVFEFIRKEEFSP